MLAQTSAIRLDFLGGFQRKPFRLCCGLVRVAFWLRFLHRLDSRPHPPPQRMAFGIAALVEPDSPALGLRQGVVTVSLHDHTRGSEHVAVVDLGHTHQFGRYCG